MTDKIQMSRLGRMGRFGNQLFQYAFLKAYATISKQELEIPAEWIGRDIFDIPDAPITEPLPKQPQGTFEFGMRNVDVKEYFQAKRFTDILTREFCKNTLAFKPYWKDKYRDKNQFDLVAHHRVGDYKRHKNFCIVSAESYNKAMSKYGYNPLDAIWVTERKQILPDGEETRFPFLHDFMQLVNAKALFRSNSTFSLWAHVLADYNQKCYSPIITGGGEMDCEFADNGAEPIMLGEDRFDFAK